MIRIRNPYGDGSFGDEWQGKWSDEMIKALPQDVKDEHNIVDEDDGEFYMSAEDFSNTVSQLHICHVLNDHVANDELGFEFEDSVSFQIIKKKHKK